MDNQDDRPSGSTSGSVKSQDNAPRLGPALQQLIANSAPSGDAKTAARSDQTSSVTADTSTPARPVEEPLDSPRHLSVSLLIADVILVIIGGGLLSDAHPTGSLAIARTQGILAIACGAWLSLVALRLRRRS